jgi:RNA polymerase sigma-70 factor, ECF subfamily
MIFFNKSRKNEGKDEAHAEFKAEALAHMEALYRTALYMTRNPERAQDLVQETYLKAHRFWHRYEPGTNCKAWLFRILTNTFINQNRRKAKIFTDIEDAGFEVSSSPLYENSGFYGTPEATYMKQLFPEHIQSAVESLPESFRIPVILADLQDFSYKEIAEMMNCPVGTVMSRLFRGRKKLQEILFEYAVEQGVISQQDAEDENGAISLEAYRARKVSGA